MRRRYYRFWSLDPIYQAITQFVDEKGVHFPHFEEIGRPVVLFKGSIYEFGLAPGRKYPEGSFELFPYLHGKPKQPTTSFPAVLTITSESQKRFKTIEKKFGLDAIPKERREILSAGNKEEWAPLL